MISNRAQRSESAARCGVGGSNAVWLKQNQSGMRMKQANVWKQLSNGGTILCG